MLTYDILMLLMIRPFRPPPVKFGLLLLQRRCSTTMTLLDARHARHANVHRLDQALVAADVQRLAQSSEPIAPLVREALDVINQAFDDHT